MDLYIRLLDDKTTFVDNEGEAFSLKKRKNNIIKKFYLPIYSTTSELEWVYEALEFKMIPRGEIDFANSLPLRIVATKTRNIMYQDFSKNSCFIVRTRKGLTKRSFDDIVLGDELVVYDADRKEITSEQLIDKMTITENGEENIRALTTDKGEQLPLFSTDDGINHDEGKMSNYMIKSQWGLIINGILITN